MGCFSIATRCAILLDELDDYRGLRRPSSLGHVVVEMATPNAIPLLRFSCSSRTMALPTGLMNARRVRAEGTVCICCLLVKECEGCRVLQSILLLLIPSW
jgi:hypothetical protein